jgi:potassium-transporting ATPase ATP-binding subunit
MKKRNNTNDKLKDLIGNTKQYNNNNNEKNGNNKTFYAKLANTMNTAILVDSVKKLNPQYLAKNNPVMFTVEIGFFLVLFISLFPNVSETFVNQDRIFYVETAIILILTVWFATFSESLSESQAKARVDSLRNLEKEVSAHKLVHGKESSVLSSSLKPGDEVRVYAGESIPRDGLIIEGKTFVDESMMTGETNPIFKEKDDHVIGGTRITSDSIIVEITAEAGKSFLDQMVGMIKNATRPKTQNEIALTILLAGLSIIFITVIGALLFLGHFVGYKIDIASLVALLVALMPTTIGGLLPAIGVAGITRIGKDNIIAKSGKGIEAAGDCDVLILDKTGTITEGSRSAVSFIPVKGYSEEDVGEIAFAASVHDTTHEGKSIIDLAEEKKYLPPILEQIITAKSIDFSAETKVSGIEFISNKKRCNLNKEQEEEFRDIAKTIKEKIRIDDSVSVDSIEKAIDDWSKSKIHNMLLQLAYSDKPVKILKGAVDVILEASNPQTTNKAEIKWKAQEISQQGATPIAVSINNIIIGLVVLKDNLKENIRRKLEEVHATGITTIMITGDNKLTAEVIAKEANVNQVMAEAKPTDKLTRVIEEQEKGHIIGMVGDGTNDAPALAKADIGLAMNSGTAAAKEAANMVDLDSDPSKILKVVKLGKQLLMTRGAITTFSIANDAAKYFAILPAMFMENNPTIAALNIMQLHSPQTAILSTLIFNALIIPALIPISLKGIRFKVESLQKIFVKNLVIYGIGGAVLPFVGIKLIDFLLSLFMK